ncbi:unnamed protein product [Didymodactylos carnosus]|nr:unnamed protein product [Didymodactylos carnosus]CAF4425551.1 unnamed protein product [Didymodactylos carnosus]
MKVNKDIDKRATAQRKLLSCSWKQANIDEMIDWIRKNYIDQEMNNIIGIDFIQWFFHKAKEENNPIYLLKAYTAETEFYTKLNQQLATSHFNESDSQFNLIGRNWILKIIFSHPYLHQYIFKGQTYRGMQISSEDLKQYKVGSHVMNKSFLSTTKTRGIAEQFAFKSESWQNSDEKKIKLSTLCTYEIKKDRSGLDIEHISEYPHEKEVLILPYSAFKVIKIQMTNAITNNGIEVEIELTECDSFVDSGNESLCLSYNRLYTIHQSGEEE